jgi:hypothetical protein
LIHAVTTANTPATPSSTPAPETPAAPEPTKAEASATPTDASQAPKVTTDLDADQVRQWSALNRANREAKAKIAALEKERDELKSRPASEPPKIASLKDAQAAGIELEALFSEWLEEDSASPPPKEVVELSERFAKLEKEREDELTARKAEEEARKSEQAKRNDEGVTAFVTNVLGGDKDRKDKDGHPVPSMWPRCAREPEAIANAKLHAVMATQALQAKGHTVSDEQAAQLVAAAFTQLEEHYAELGRRYALDGVPPRGPNVRGPTRVREPVASRTSVTIDSNRGSLRKPTQQPPAFQSFREIKAEILARRTNRN